MERRKAQPSGFLIDDVHVIIFRDRSHVLVAHDQSRMVDMENGVRLIDLHVSWFNGAINESFPLLDTNG